MQTKVLNGVAVVFAAVVLGAIVWSASGAFTHASGSSSGKVASGTVPIAIHDLAFVDGARTVLVGSTVRWTNRDATTHTVTARHGAFASRPTDDGQTFSHHFTTTGRFPYFCSIHTFMHGDITVVAGYGKQ